MNRKQIAMIFAAVIVACVFSTDLLATAAKSTKVSDANSNKQPSYTEYPGEIGDIARRAEKRIKEVNEDVAIEKQNLEAVKREQYFEDNKEERAGSLLSKDDIARLENDRIQEVNAIRTKTINEIKSLEAQQSVSSIDYGQRTLAPTPVRGMVTGIVFCNNRGASLVGDQIVRENDVVLDVKVLKITADYVEFEKQGSKWKQQVGQMPQASYWEPPTQIPADRQPPTVPQAKTRPGR
jgi:hypothetical protein